MNVLALNPPSDNGVRIVREGRCMQRQEAWGTSWAPITLATIAAILRDSGFTVRLKDCSNDGMGFEQLKREIEDFQPKLVVVNTSTPSIVGDLKIASLTREIDKDIKTIFLGTHVTALPEEVFEEKPNVEFIVDGEPEYTVRDFAVAIRDSLPMNGVKGLIYKAKNNELIRNEKRPLTMDLDEFPYPDWDLVNLKGYRLPISNRPLLLVLTGRGCPHSCTFCVAGTFYGKKPRFRSWKKIVSEIKYMRERYGIHDFLFWSENAISDRNHIYEICKGLINEAPGIRWVCTGRVDMIDEDLLKVMKKAGCWMIGYGIESGTQRVLDLMKKTTTIKHIVKAVETTKKVGIEVTGFVIIGYPGETKSDISNTVKLLRRLDPDYIQVFGCIPFPGSSLYEESKKSGLLATRDWVMYEQNFSVINTPDLSAQEVMALREKIIKDFYFNPRKILKTLLKIRSFQELASFVSFAKRYFTCWVNNTRRHNEEK